MRSGVESLAQFQGEGATRWSKGVRGEGRGLRWVRGLGVGGEVRRAVFGMGWNGMGG